MKFYVNKLHEVWINYMKFINNEKETHYEHHQVVEEHGGSVCAIPATNTSFLSYYKVLYLHLYFHHHHHHHRLCPPNSCWQRLEPSPDKSMTFHLPYSVSGWNFFSSWKDEKRHIHFCLSPWLPVCSTRNPESREKMMIIKN